MPRAEQSPVSRITGFFRTSNLEVAELVLALCKDEVAVRRKKSADAKARTTEGAGASPAGKPKSTKKGPGKKRGPKSATQPATPGTAPTAPASEGDPTAGDPGE